MLRRWLVVSGLSLMGANGGMLIQFQEVIFFFHGANIEDYIERKVSQNGFRLLKFPHTISLSTCYRCMGSHSRSHFLGLERMMDCDFRLSYMSSDLKKALDIPCFCNRDDWAEKRERGKLELHTTKT